MAIRILALSGSGRAGSKSRAALDVAVQGAKKAGATVEVIDLAELALPMFDGVNGKPDADVVPVVRQFRQAAREANGFLFATPVYHDSLSGVLKNAIDHLYLELADKPAGIISIAGGRAGAALALEHLRTILRETQTWVLPRQVPIGNSAESFDAGNVLTDKETTSRLVALGVEVAARTQILRPRAAAAAPTEPKASGTTGS